MINFNIQSNEIGISFLHLLHRSICLSVNHVLLCNLTVTSTPSSFGHYTCICVDTMSQYSKKVNLCKIGKLLDCHCAGRPFQRMPLLISSTGPTASRSHQATTCSWSQQVPICWWCWVVVSYILYGKQRTSVHAGVKVLRKSRKPLKYKISKHYSSFISIISHLYVYFYEFIHTYIHTMFVV